MRLTKDEIPVQTFTASGLTSDDLMKIKNALYWMTEDPHTVDIKSFEELLDKWTHLLHTSFQL